MDQDENDDNIIIITSILIVVYILISSTIVMDAYAVVSTTIVISGQFMVASPTIVNDGYIYIYEAAVAICGLFHLRVLRGSFLSLCCCLRAIVRYADVEERLRCTGR